MNAVDLAVAFNFIVLFGAVTGMLAHTKHRRVVPWAVAGALCGALVLIVIALVDDLAPQTVTAPASDPPPPGSFHNPYTYGAQS